MAYSRRDFLGVTGGLVLSGIANSFPVMAGGGRKAIKAIAFDAFPIFNPKPVFALASDIYREKGKEFSTLWRTRIFEYTWLRSAAGQYKDFWSCIEDALVYTAKTLKLELTAGNRKRFMDSFLEIKAFPEVKQVLSEFRATGIRLAFLSNMTEQMLRQGIVNSGLEGYFEHLLSTDRVRTFKPDPRAYQMAIDAFRLERDEIAFAAFAGWDAVGAKWFGYPTVWVNRLGFTEEQFGIQPDATGQDLVVLKDFVLTSRRTG